MRDPWKGNDPTGILSQFGVVVGVLRVTQLTLLDDQEAGCILYKPEMGWEGYLSRTISADEIRKYRIGDRIVLEQERDA